MAKGKVVVLILMYEIIFSTSYSKAVAGNLIPDDKSPVTFLQNQGQWASAILYKGNSITSPVCFVRDGLSFSRTGREEVNADGSVSSPFVVWNMKFVNPDPDLVISGSDERESKYSFLSGSDSSQWVIHPREFSGLKYGNVYPKIDLYYYGQNNSLKYDYIVHPGGAMQAIKIYYEGIRNLFINKDGDLEVITLRSNQLQKKPVAWQIINGEKKNIQISYEIINDTTFGFKAKKGFNPNYDLVIDPLFQMVWSSYTKITGGGNNMNYCFANAVDNDGNVYLTGYSDNSFPITAGAYSGASGVAPEVYVAKFSSDGSTLIYWTYLLGESSEFGTDIAVDEFGRAYVTGVVDVNFTGTTSFSTTTNAYQSSHNGGSDAFLTVLNPTGTGLDYSTFLGGTGSEQSYGIALGGQGIAYITGYTSIGNFPVKASTVFPTGDNDAFVAKFNINQTGANSLIYSIRMGGGPFSNSIGRSITIDTSGNAYITGKISSSFGVPLYPTTTGAYNSAYNPGLDGSMFFVTKLNNNIPVGLSYSTFVAPGIGNAIDVDPLSGDAFVSGTTYTTSFPTTAGALQTIHAGTGGTDGFVIRLNTAGSALVYSTFLGGKDYDNATGIEVNSAGEAYISGITQDSFPTSTGAYQPNNAGTFDFFIVNLNASGTGYGCGGSTYIGGSDADYSGSFYDYPVPKISIRDHSGTHDTICISATSHSQNFPTTAGVYGPVKVNGIADQPVFFKLTCIPAGALPNVSFVSSDTSWCDKKAIDYFDVSTNNPTSWQWYFQGAIPDTSTLQNPAGIYYPAYGTFDVKLVACNAIGCDSLIRSSFVTEFQIPVAPLITQGHDTLYATAASGYQWYNQNGKIPGANNYWYVVTQPGNYFVVIHDSIGCINSSGQFLITGINQFGGPMIAATVNPNPFSKNGILGFYLNIREKVEINLFNMEGRKVRSVFNGILDAGKQGVKINAGELEKGMYVCEIRTTSHAFKTKIIIQ